MQFIEVLKPAQLIKIEKFKYKRTKFLQLVPVRGVKLESSVGSKGSFLGEGGLLLCALLLAPPPPLLL